MDEREREEKREKKQNNEAKLVTKPITSNEEEGGEAQYEDMKPITRSHGTIEGKFTRPRES